MLACGQGGLTISAPKALVLLASLWMLANVATCTNDVSKLCALPQGVLYADMKSCGWTGSVHRAQALNYYVRVGAVGTSFDLIIAMRSISGNPNL